MLRLMLMLIFTSCLQTVEEFLPMTRYSTMYIGWWKGSECTWVCAGIGDEKEERREQGQEQQSCHSSHDHPPLKIRALRHCRRKIQGNTAIKVELQGVTNQPLPPKVPPAHLPGGPFPSGEFPQGTNPQCDSCKTKVDKRCKEQHEKRAKDCSQ